MLARRIIPCLDVDRGRVVKGIRFLGLIDAGDPVEQAQRYDREGADELVFLDITASSDSREIVASMVRRVADSVFIPFTVGGGIRATDDIKRILASGADKVSLNTSAVNDPSLITSGARAVGSQAIVIAIDARRWDDEAEIEAGDKAEGADRTDRYRVQGVGSETGAPCWQVYTHGGRVPTGIDVIEWARRAEELGAGEILLTSMNADGTRNGYDIELTRAVSDAVSVPVIASGGAGTLDHLYQALAEGNASAVLAASIFHFGEFTIAQAKDYLRGRGLPMR